MLKANKNSGIKFIATIMIIATLLVNFTEITFAEFTSQTKIPGENISAVTEKNSTKGTRDGENANKEEKLIPSIDRVKKAGEDQYVKTVASLKSFAKASREQMRTISEFTGINSGLLLEAEKHGYSVEDAILAAKIILNTHLSFQEVKEALKNYENLKLIYVASNQYKKMLETWEFPENLVNELKQLLISGHRVLDIEKAGIVAKIFNVSLLDIIPKESETDIWKEIEKHDNIEERNALFKITLENNISIKWLLEFMEEKGITYKDFEKQIKDFYKNAREVRIPEQTGEKEQDMQLAGGIRTLSAPEEEEYKAPFSYEEYGQDKIERNTGNLIFEYTDVHLPGKNGLDFTLISRYDSDEAVFNEDEVKYVYGQQDRYDVAVVRDVYYYGVIHVDHQICLTYKNISSAEYMRLRDIYENNYIYEYDEENYYLYEYSLELMDEYTVPGYKYEWVWAYTPTYNQMNSPLGVGWSFVFDSIEIVSSDSYYNNHQGTQVYLVKKAKGKYLHLSSGEVYKIGDNLKLEGYKLADMQLKLDSSYTNGQNVKSYYALVYKDGIKKYFANDGRLLATKDRYGNTIEYQHTNINGYYVITKIIDTLGREVTIDYDFDNLKVVVSAPDNYKVTYNLSWDGFIKDRNDGSIKYYTYRVNSRVDAYGRQTTFTYDNYIRQIFFEDDGDRLSPSIPLSKVTYPTGMYVEYTYTTYNSYNTGRYIGAGNEYYPKVLKRTIYRKTGVQQKYNEYCYMGSYTGYPFKNKDTTLPWLQELYHETYKFVAADREINTLSIEYEFDKENLLIGQKTYRITGSASNDDGSFTIFDHLLLSSTEYKYNTNTDRQLKQKITKIYTIPDYTVPEYVYEPQNLNKYIQKTEDFYFDQYGNLVKYWGTEASRNSNNQLVNPENDLHKVQYTYDTANYHLLKGLEYKKDASTTIKRVNTLTSDKKGIYESRILQNGVVKSKTVYGYDQWGNITSEKLYTDEGTWTQYIENTYSYMDNDPQRNSRYNFNGAYLTTKSVTGVLDADGSTGTISETYQYDSYGRVIKNTDPKGYVTSYQYDLLGRKTQKTSPDGSSVYYYYDDVNNILRVKNENNTEIDYIYDEFGNLRYERDVAGEQDLKEYQYDENFRLILESNNTSCDDYYVIEYIYNDDGSLKEKTTKGANDAIIAQEKYLYDHAFDLDGNGTADYSKITRIITGDSQSPSVVTTQYIDRQGLIRREGKIHQGEEYYTTYNYDYVGNRIEEKSARANDENWAVSYTTRYEYDHAGRLTKVQDVNGNISTVVYDAIGRVIAKTDNKGNLASPAYSTLYTYNVMGNVIQESIPFEKVGSTVYSTIKKYYYDANGNLTLEKVTSNAPGQTETYNQTGYEYDSRNRLVKVTTYDNGVPENYTQYYYDAAGNKLRMYTGLSSPLTINGLDNVVGQDMEYSVTKYVYDRFNRLVEMTDPLGKKEFYTYDLNGYLISKTDRNNNIITLAYDGLGRLISKSVATPDGNGNEEYTYTYTLTGNRSSMEGTETSITYFYDDLGRLIKETGTDGIEKTYTYDASNNRKSFVLKQNGVTIINTTYDYDNMDRLWKVYENGVLTATYEYDENGNRKKLTYNANGITTDYTYNLANRLTALTNKQGTTTISSYAYTYFLDGNQASKTDHTGKVTSYAYDGLGRLISESPQGEAATVYTYDDSNNRKTMTKGNVVTTYDYDSNNRLTTETKVDGDVTYITRYGYDNNGNQIYKGLETIKPSVPGENEEIAAGLAGKSADNFDITLMEYDGFNQLKNVITGNTIAEYAYNPDGLRIEKTVNGVKVKHIWDGSQLALEVENDGQIIGKYIRGINLIAAEDGAGSRKYYLYNGHGDVIQLTDISGNVIKNYDYDAFGNELNIDNMDTNPFRYCGEYFDKETGTIYLRARYYDPATSRMLTEDSYWGDIRDPLSLNLYTYCKNNPILYFDPSGHDAVLDQYISDNYAGKITVTIVVAQPVPGSRQAIDSDFSGDVGHTFIRLDFGDGRVIYKGFYPKDPLTSEQILNRENVTGQINDDSEHGWNVAQVFVIDQNQAEKIEKFINNYGKDYNMVSNNCTTFAVDALKSAGIKSPTSAHKWTLPDGAHKLLVDNLPKEIRFKNIVAWWLLNGLKGYSPGDAGEDIRDNTGAIINTNGTVSTSSGGKKR
ncbi:MAG: RHS repeat-associated core domain-containing protein [Acetivibrionales bacterium]